MTVAEAMQKMILLSDANFHDINHFLKVHAYALIIGACEGLSQAQRYTLELAAIVHDIACPLCRCFWAAMRPARGFSWACLQWH